jgi:hypothetical protein
MSITFIKNGIVSNSVPIKWRFHDHPTVWFSLPANFENNIVVKAHYLGLKSNHKVVILNGEVKGCSRIFKEKKITETDESADFNTAVTGFTTTLYVEPIDIPSRSIVNEEQSVQHSPSTTQYPNTKRKANK